jgi:hypothetical protein
MRQVLSNGDTGLSFRSKANDNFEELYTELTVSLLYLGVLTSSESGSGNFPATRPAGDSYADGDWYYIADDGSYFAPGGTVTCYEGDMLIRNQNSTWERIEGSKKGPKEVIQYSTDGGKSISPGGATDPLVIETITHTFTKTYSAAPSVAIVNLVAFWGLSISSVTTTQVILNSSGVGDADASNFDYKLLVF